MFLLPPSIEKSPNDNRFHLSDLFVTNVKRLERGIKENSANAILIKPNQIGSVTETIKAVQMAQNKGFIAII